MRYVALGCGAQRFCGCGLLLLGEVLSDLGDVRVALGGGSLAMRCSVAMFSFSGVRSVRLRSCSWMLAQ